MTIPIWTMTATKRHEKRLIKKEMRVNPQIVTICWIGLALVCLCFENWERSGKCRPNVLGPFPAASSDCLVPMIITLSHRNRNIAMARESHQQKYMTWLPAQNPIVCPKALVWKLLMMLHCTVQFAPLSCYVTLQGHVSNIGITEVHGGNRYHRSHISLETNWLRS